MKKIIVIGCPGSGKSTLSEKLSSCINIPIYHLDNIYWLEDKSVISKEEFLEKLEQIMKNETWIIDGNYSATIELRLQNCDTVIFLDYDTQICLNGIEERKGKKRTDIPWVETEPNTEFIELIKTFGSTKRPQIMELLKKYKDKQIYIFKNREQAAQFLDN